MFEKVALSLPAVVTADLRLKQPCYVTLPNIMKAKKKALEILSPRDLQAEVVASLRTLKVVEPAGRAAGIKVSDVEVLQAKLRGEAKVI